MRQIPARHLWIGHAGNMRDPRAVLAAGVRAVVDLAVEEPPKSFTRELVICRIPLVDGAGNPPWLLQFAVETVATLRRRDIPTLVACGAGMSRAPTIVAAALAVAEGLRPDDCLELVAAGAGDVSPALWHEVKAACNLSATHG